MVLVLLDVSNRVIAITHAVANIVLGGLGSLSGHVTGWSDRVTRLVSW